METKQLGTTEQDLALAGELLRQGQLVAFPTERCTDWAPTP